MIAIIATLSILVCITAISCIVCLVMVPVRFFLHKSVKPFAIAATVSAVLFLVIGITEGIIYEPPEGVAEYGTETTENTTIVVSETTTESTTETTTVHTTESTTAVTTTKKAVETTTEKSKATTVKKTDSAKNKNPEQPAAIKQEVTTVKREQPVVKTTAAPASAPAPASNQDIIEKYRSDLAVAAHITLENFVSDYKIPYAATLWKLAKFDKAGAIIAMTDVTKKSTGTTEAAIVVLSPVFQNGKMTETTPHFVSVGDIVYGNDGYCDDVFSSISEISGMFGG